MSSAAALAVLLATVATALVVDSPAAQRRRLAPPTAVPDGLVRTPRQRLETAAGAALASAALGSLLGGGAWFLLAPPCAAAGYWASGKLERRGARLHRLAAIEALPATLELLAACVEAGAPLRSAVHRVAALAPPGSAAALRRLDAAVGLGMDEPAAWEQLRGDAAWGPVARDVVRSLATGTASRDVLLQHAGEVRRASQAARLGRARSVGVRSTIPLMTCFLPAFLLLGVVPIVASLIPRFL